MSTRLAISIGDINGIGPEVVLKTLQEHPCRGLTPLILSSAEVVRYYMDLLNIGLDIAYAKTVDEVVENRINILESYSRNNIEPQPGILSKESGKLAMEAVDKGVTLCMNKQADALVTAPISKEAVNLAGYDIPGHTEFLAEKTGAGDFMMLLVNNELRVGLLSIHIPLKEAAPAVTEPAILNKLKTMHLSLKTDFGIPDPEIAVLGLNPHAGDGGIIGNEEVDVIAPALQKARFNDIKVKGPFPADGFFGNRKYEQYDGILAMYHDQGLIPFKTLSFGAGVNFTAGLPIIRTSPDHGTAFDIAGENKADPESFRQALELAVKLARNRVENRDPDD